MLSEPLCTRHMSAAAVKGCECSVVTALSVAMRVWPIACEPAIATTSYLAVTVAGRPTSLKTSIASP